ncbi:hypothetical protein M9H77_36345 [Catharanthus roseus]|uniref:Uncharacterized protein n=1 Tax=Catharanthus roseus TaxID=4058 RepID=A0ACB9ZSE3_CATRO|nr:hypothetical protein M9H77_36345 [Catharanthus roseus]
MYTIAVGVPSITKDQKYKIGQTPLFSQKIEIAEEFPFPGETPSRPPTPSVYVAESAIIFGIAVSSADGSKNTAAIVADLALISIAVASSILLQVGKNSPPMQIIEHSGPPLSYYISIS